MRVKIYLLWGAFLCMNKNVHTSVAKFSKNKMVSQCVTAGAIDVVHKVKNHK